MVGNPLEISISTKMSTSITNPHFFCQFLVANSPQKKRKIVQSSLQGTKKHGAPMASGIVRASKVDKQHPGHQQQRERHGESKPIQQNWDEF